jgi:competence ComEA-like helix-hairpin-helix protein
VWSARQRAVVLALLVGIFVYLCVRYALNPVYVPTPQPLEGSRAAELADRFDPNTATQAELAAVPGMGEKLAAAIVEYRDAYAKLHGGKMPFGEPNDLLAVKGIGVAKLEGIEPYLTFPPSATTKAATRSAR